MTGPLEKIRRLQRRLDHLKARLKKHDNSYDAAEASALEWAIESLQITHLVKPLKEKDALIGS